MAKLIIEDWHGKRTEEFSSIEVARIIMRKYLEETLGVSHWYDMKDCEQFWGGYIAVTED